MAVDFIDSGPREHHGRPLDEVATEETRRLRQRIGGMRDPLPVAGRPAMAICDDCGNEHTTYAAYMVAHAAEHEPPTESRYCLGCIARMVDQSRLLEPSSIPGTCEEFDK